MPEESRADQALRNALVVVEHHRLCPEIPLEYLIAQTICAAIENVFQTVAENLQTLHAEGMKRAHRKWAIEAAEELRERAGMEVSIREAIREEVDAKEGRAE